MHPPCLWIWQNSLYRCHNHLPDGYPLCHDAAVTRPKNQCFSVNAKNRCYSEVQGILEWFDHWIQSLSCNILDIFGLYWIYIWLIFGYIWLIFGYIWIFIGLYLDIFGLYLAYIWIYWIYLAEPNRTHPIFNPDYDFDCFSSVFIFFSWFQKKVIKLVLYLIFWLFDIIAYVGVRPCLWINL